MDSQELGRIPVFISLSPMPPSCDHSSCSTVSVMATKRPKLVECHCLWNKFQCLFLWLKYTTYQCNSDVACKSHLFHHQWVHHPNISYQFCWWGAKACWFNGQVFPCKMADNPTPQKSSMSSWGQQNHSTMVNIDIIVASLENVVRKSNWYNS